MWEWVVSMEYKFTIPGRLDGLNDYTAANRTNPRKGGRVKKDNESVVIWCIRQQLPGVHITKPVLIYYHFFEKDMRRDGDNILSCGTKFIQDSLKSIRYCRKITGIKYHIFIMIFPWIRTIQGLKLSLRNLHRRRRKCH